METMDEMLRKLNELYDEQIRFEKEYYNRAMALVNSDLVDQINEIKDELNSILWVVRKNIRDLEKTIRLKALDQERSFESPDLFVEFVPWIKTTMTFPGMDIEPVVQTQSPRVKIIRKNNKPKRYKEAQMMMRLF